MAKRLKLGKRPVTSGLKRRIASVIGSYKLLSPLALVFSLAVGKDFITFRGVNDESVIVAGLDAVVDLDIPVLQRCSHGFDFPLDALFNG